MSFTRLLDRDATILSAPLTTDRYGDDVRDWSNPTARPARCSLAQTSSISDLEHRAGTTTEAVATFDLTARPYFGERVVVDGITYKVLGEPRVAVTPRGPHHVEAHLEAVIG